MFWRVLRFLTDFEKFQGFFESRVCWTRRLMILVGVPSRLRLLPPDWLLISHKSTLCFLTADFLYSLSSYFLLSFWLLVQKPQCFCCFIVSRLFNSPNWLSNQILSPQKLIVSKQLRWERGGWNISSSSFTNLNAACVTLPFSVSSHSQVSSHFQNGT